MMQQYHIIIDKNKRETTRHGEYEFPLAIYTTEIRKNILGFVDWHWHDELQLCLVTRGTVSFNVDDETLVLPTGQGLFINKGQLHRASDAEQKDSAYICLDFHSHLISGFEGGLIDRDYVAPYINNAAIPYVVLTETVDWQKRVMDIIREIYDEHENHKANNEIDITIDLLRIWREFVIYCFPGYPSVVPGSDKLRCKQIISYIEAHYSERIVLTELAAQLNLSQGTCCRDFKEAMKCTIFEYIMNYRITESARLLLTTDESINEIAYQCGFSSASYFIGQFRKKTGKTPAIYRKESIKIK